MTFKTFDEKNCKIKNFHLDFLQLNIIFLLKYKIKEYTN